ARQETQRLLNLVGEGQRMLGNALVALSELRCNLGAAPPRPLQLARPLPHYGPPMLVQQATIPIQVCLTAVPLTGGVGVQLPPLPPEFLQAVAHQITQQAMAAAASAATGTA
ncbi:BAG6 protein, partial [Toxostoma redivivum]|nr:BAG6 protein [Toxostoma redivivum]